MSRKTEQAIIEAAYQWETSVSHEETLAALKALKKAVISDIDESSKPAKKRRTP